MGDSRTASDDLEVPADAARADPHPFPVVAIMLRGLPCGTNVALFRFMAWPSSGTHAHSHGRGEAGTSGLFRHVAVCIDGSSLAEWTVPHAVAMARAFDAELSVLHVLETRHNGDAALPDPLDWQLARFQAADYLHGVVARTRAGSTVDRNEEVQSELLEGAPPLQIRRWIEDHGVDLAVICTHGTKGPTEWPLASTARKLLDELRCSMLVVPAAAVEEGIAAPRYARVLIPLDGSLWSESALPFAVRLAEVHDATLILAHAVPCPDLTRAGAIPPTSEDLELERRLITRNERVGREYLDHLRARLSATGLNVSTVVESEGTVSSELKHAIARAEPDLIVLPACGASGPGAESYGAIALYLLTQASKPVLLLRPPPGTVGVQPWSGPRGTAARPPSQASS